MVFCLLESLSVMMYLYIQLMTASLAVKNHSKPTIVILSGMFYVPLKLSVMT